MLRKHSNGYKISLHSKYEVRNASEWKQPKEKRSEIVQSKAFNQMNDSSFLAFFFLFVSFFLPFILLSCCFFIKMNGLCNVFLDKNRSEQQNGKKSGKIVENR